MKRTAQDILNFVEDNDVKFAKLTFCDAMEDLALVISM